jgi:hypothetical protein
MNTLREDVREYLEMRRSLGFKLRDAGKGFIEFVTFLERRNASYITQALSLAWAQKPVNVQPAWWAQRLSFVRGFARAIAAPLIGASRFRRKACCPSNRMGPDPICTQMKRSASYCAPPSRMPCRYERGRLRPWVYYSLFGLLSVTGLRLIEARNLKLEDVDLKAAVLTTDGSKFGKTRLVPLHSSTCRCSPSTRFATL